MEETTSAQSAGVRRWRLSTGCASVYELVVGYHDEDQHLQFASKVKDGFVPHDRPTLYRALQFLLVPDCTFVNLTTSEHASSHWGGGGISAANMLRRFRCAGFPTLDPPDFLI